MSVRQGSLKALKKVVTSPKGVKRVPLSPYIIESRIPKHLKSSTSTNNTSPRKFVSPDTRSKITPVKKSNSRTESIFTMKSLNTSKDTIGKTTGNLHDLSKEDTWQSPVYGQGKINFCDCDCQIELRLCKREIAELKLKLKKLQSSGKNKKTGKEGRSKEMLFKLLLEKQEAELTKRYSQEFDLMYEKLVKKLRKQQYKSIVEKEKEIEERFKCEIELIEKENEAKMKLRIKEILSENERKIIRVQDENVWLKKQLADSKTHADDAIAKYEIEKTVVKSEIALKKNSFAVSDNYHELLDSYNQLQKDYFELKKKNLCVKCKSFTKTDEDMTKKMSTIRDYLNCNKNV